MAQPRINYNAHLREVHRNLMVHTAEGTRNVQQSIYMLQITDEALVLWAICCGVCIRSV